MSLETEIREAFERHADDARPSGEAWAGVERRIERSHRRRTVAAGLAGIAAIAAIAVAAPRLTSNPEPLLPTPRQTPILEPDLRLEKTLQGTSEDVFDGEILVDPIRDLLLIGEQHDAPPGVENRVRVVDARTLETVRRIGPGFLRAVDPVRGHVYLGSFGRGGNPQNTISVHAIDSGAQVASLPVGEEWTMALDPTKGRVYIDNAGAIDVYDAATFRLLRTFAVGAASIAIDHKEQVLIVSREDPIEVVLMDPETGRELATVTGLENPVQGSPLVTAGDGFFTTSIGTYEGSDLRLYKTDGGALVWKVAIDRRVGRPAIDAGQKLVFNSINDLTDSEFVAPNDAPDVVEVRSLDGGTSLGSVELPEGPVAMAIDAPDRRIYVISLLGNSVVALTY